jgi:RimJ/RimL family protein N-acetyltransferase
MSQLPFPINPPLPHIREYRDEDAEEVARMWRESVSVWPGGGAGGGEQATAARVRQDQRTMNTLATFIAFLPDPETGEERAAGYCSLFEYTAEENTAYVGTLSAHPAWHGKGVGRDLLRASLERTVALGYERLDLHTWAGNLKAMPLYKKSGYFWAPDTSVKMENYLPLIFRLPAAQAFFQHADWYRDLMRDLSLEPDEERLGNVEVYTYTWEREGRFLKVAVDRRARSVVLLGTEAYEVSIAIDDPRLPVGGSRRVSWRFLNRGSDPVPVSLLAEGEDAVRCTFQTAATVGLEQEWQAVATAEQPRGAAPVRRPANRVRSTAVVAGQPVQLGVGTQVVQPVGLSFDPSARWLVPGVPRTTWLTLTNHLDEPVRGEVRLSATPGLILDQREISFDIEPRRRLSRQLTIQAGGAGTWTLRAQALVHGGPAEGPLRTKVFEQSVHAGEPGGVFVEQTDDAVAIAAGRLLVDLPLKPGRGWSPRLGVRNRETGRSLLTHTSSLGPPFSPSVFVNSTWTARVERQQSMVSVVLSTSPPDLPGITFERCVEVSASGLMRLTYRTTNAGEVSRQLQVSAGTQVDLAGVPNSQVAAPLVAGLVVDDSMRFPDWEEPDVTRPERYAESWMAEFGDGWVGATIWREVEQVQAGWSAPSLTLDLGTIPPGGQAETAPLYLYAGQGDWRTARALWRELIAPDAPAEHPAPRPAHRVRLERLVFEQPVGQTQLLLESERTRPLSGTLRLEGVDAVIAEPGITQVRHGTPHATTVEVTLPKEAGAVPATIVLDHERTTERVETAFVRLGDGDQTVAVTAGHRGDVEVVQIDNGRMRLAVVPAEMGRVQALSVRNAAGEWVNQLHSPETAPGIFVWFNPWYGGIHPNLEIEGEYPGRLVGETFTWQATKRTGLQGNRWKGISLHASLRGERPAGTKVAAGLTFEIAYLTTGESNVLAMPFRLENQSGARVNGAIYLHAFLQPGGDRTGVVLHYQRQGEEVVRTHKRVHGGMWGSASHWAAVAGASGEPAIVTVPSGRGASVEPWDMGLEGAHPTQRFRIRLDPGESYSATGYIVVAPAASEAPWYRVLAEVGGLA